MNRLPYALLGAILILNCIVLRPELSIARVDLNDDVSHFTIIERMARAVETGGNPVDFWVPETSFGYAIPRTYQPLSDALVVSVYYLFAKSVALQTVFIWIRYLSEALLPLSFFFAARLLTLPPWTALAAALLSPLIVSNGLYGIEYGSYVWAGNGLFPQSVATHFLLLAIGFAWGAIHAGRRIALAGFLLGLTFLAHFVFGYMGGLTIILMALVPDPKSSPKMRIRRVVIIAAVALLPAAFELLSLWQDGPLINHSHWEPVWKWDSFGMKSVAQWLFTGDLLDHGRFAVLSLLALAGVLILLPRREGSNWRRPAESSSAPHLFVAAASMMWLLLFCGRPTWGPLLKLFGISGDVQIHRFLTAAHIFLLFTAAIGLAALWDWITPRWGVWGAVAATIVLVAPAAWERGKYLGNNETWGLANLASYDRERFALDSVLDKARERGGRVYPGLAGGWGGQFKIGDVPIFAFLSVRGIPSVSFLYHSLALTSDIMVRFNENDDQQYRLFNIRTVIAPQGQKTAPFLTPIEESGRFRLLEAPGSGYFDIVDVPYAATVDKDALYGLDDRWLASDLVAKREHIGLDLGSTGFAGVPRIRAADPMPPVSWQPSPGNTLSESEGGDAYEAQVNVVRPAWILFRMTYHPNWRMTVDGARASTVMLSPGFVGAPIAPGKHTVTCRYEPGSLRLWLAIAGLMLALALTVTQTVLPSGTRK